MNLSDKSVWGCTFLLSCMTAVLSQSKDCFIGFDGSAVVYATAGRELLCQVEKINTDLFSINVHTMQMDADWLSYDPTKQLLIGTPEKIDIGTTNITITVSPKSCSTTEEWTVTIPLIVELPQQAIRSLTGSCTGNTPPRVSRPVNHIQATAGEVFNLSLDPLTFIDKEDGSTRDLQISLKALFNEELPDNFWLKLDKTSLTLYGIPLQNENMYVVNLVAKDICGELSRDSIRVDIKEQNVAYNHEFTVFFGHHRYSEFEVFRFINGLVLWLNTSEIFVSDAEQGLSVSWVDKSLSRDVCERQKILDTYYLMADENGTVLEEFRCFLSPFFNVSAVLLDFKDMCNVSLMYGISTSTDVSFDRGHNDMYLFYILIPVAVLTVVILLVILILLIRKCMKRNRYVMNSEKPIYLTDRQPVIFQNEYNDEETALKSQTPIVIDNYDAVSASSNGQSQGRVGTNPPSYSVQPQHDPPQYRLPPPYHISGV